MDRVAAVLALVLTVCVSAPVSGEAQPTRTFDPSACYERDINVYFEEWEYQLNADARQAVAEMQTILAGCRIDSVHIIGAAGATGNADANLEVSQQRAQAIADALAEGGWARDKFELAAIGDAGATAGDVNQPMRRRARIVVRAAAP